MTVAGQTSGAGRRLALISGERARTRSSEESTDPETSMSAEQVLPADLRIRRESEPLVGSEATGQRASRLARRVRGNARGYAIGLFALGLVAAAKLALAPWVGAESPFLLLLGARLGSVRIPIVTMHWL